VEDVERSMLQHSGAGTVPRVVESELTGSAVSAPATRHHSVVDGKHVSDSAVQFDAIIISDSNSVSTSQSIWLSVLTFAPVIFVILDLNA